MKLFSGYHRHLLVSAICLLLSVSAFAFGPEQKVQPFTSIASLEAAARQRVNIRPRVELVSESSEVFRGIASLESAGSGRVPNYLRALSPMPTAIKPLAEGFQTYFYGGTIAADVKLAMALRIAQVNNSPYAAVHLSRLLSAETKGAEILNCLRADKASDMPVAVQQAVRYAEMLTRDALGITDAEFQKVSGTYNDAQIVELTMVVCFLNYFTRYVEALNLPVESWAIDPQIRPVLPAVRKSALTQARIALISDEEMQAVIAADTARKNPTAQSGGLGIGLANSQRAMMRVPDIQAAWRGFTSAVRAKSEIGREMQLQVSFAVSMANGCRYCIVHQVVGLRRQGVDPSKLIAMKKDDSALTPRELTAVTFARKLTKGPASITDADYETLRREFGEYGAMEVLLQTCTFNFMNRFTDNLRLPSEDEAIHIYQEVYGVVKK